jgi:hypothetical protein
MLFNRFALKTYKNTMCLMNSWQLTSHEKDRAENFKGKSPLKMIQAENNGGGIVSKT